MICTESITDTIATDYNACGGWVHQTCANFTSENDQHSDFVQTYICKSCRLMDQHETDHDTETTPRVPQTEGCPPLLQNPNIQLIYMMTIMMSMMMKHTLLTRIHLIQARSLTRKLYTQSVLPA
ncbi:hypothetical protein DPMN_097773 [Dreissena polymorpha]|uniref:Uncharacterized protein n=1 Tax=Dreissena polymorpha TaxID=45954 RepID=A0A9D4R514_DREPO|nr:hypothetical protein DPMN_097773 [Dreissena polymorpha]